MAKKNYELIAVSTSSNQLLHFQPVRSTTPIWETVGGFANVGCFLKLKSAGPQLVEKLATPLYATHYSCQVKE